MNKKIKTISVLFMVVFAVSVGTVAYVVMGSKDAHLALANVQSKPNPPAQKSPSDNQTSAANMEWQTRCVGAEKKQCELFKTVHIAGKEKQFRLSEVAISSVEGQSAKIGVSLPLGVTLTEGLALQIDEGNMMSIPFSVCSTGGCLATGNIDQSVLSQLKSGNILNVYFLDGANKRIKIQLSLLGLAKGMDSL